LLALGYGFKMAFKKKDLVFISFMLVVAIVSLSENVLDADKGVMFYSFFFAFFLFSDSSKKASLTGKNKSRENSNEMATNSLIVTSY
jgi:hypothetical protein